MAKKTRNSEMKTADYRHTGTKRKNIPPAKIAAEGKVPKVAKVRYEYSPHLPPVLRVDPTGKADKLPELITTAGKRPLNESEQKLLAAALRNQQPWLEWAGKREQHDRGFFDVDPLALHIHERISTQAIVRVASREDVQRALFADPQQSYGQAVQFYRHDVDWANRLILGDSAQVMTSLARRENLAGRVQMIFMDPPYGINFKSNFQPSLVNRDPKDRDRDLTREPEMVQAYRDTWTFGIHSYLSYLRDRLLAARDLLDSTGSIFVQISDENIHLVRTVLDEVFGTANFCQQVVFTKTTSTSTTTMPAVCDYLLWYARDAKRVRYRKIYRELDLREEVNGEFKTLEERTGLCRPLTADERNAPHTIAEGCRVFRTNTAVSPEPSEKLTVTIHFNGIAKHPGEGRHWKTGPDGMMRLLKADRLELSNSPSRMFRRFLDDSPVAELSNVWTDTRSEQKQVYAVQTNATVLERCILMTTDPGDLVLDPTCGGGTTAFASEKWGRRWITCDTSRVALALARQRLLTSSFPYFRLQPVSPGDLKRNPLGAWLTEAGAGNAGAVTFKYKTVPRISLSTISGNRDLDPIFETHQSALDRLLEQLNLCLRSVSTDTRQRLTAKLLAKQKISGKQSITEADQRRWTLPTAKWQEWEVPFDTDSDWPKPLQDAVTSYRTTWRARMDDVNACIAASAGMEELVDKPVEVKGIVRVTGPFTVEGVRPEELSLGEEGLFDPTPNEDEADGATFEGADNSQTYLTQMVQHLRTDGLTFLGNQHRKFSSLDPLFEAGSGSLIHAEGSWEGAVDNKGNTVAITFGPQHGPVTALQLEEAIRAAKQYDDLVIAGFSFDAEAFAVAEEQSHPKLRVHLAQIRPDLNEAMQGLLKDTPNSQLFTVFGQPDVVVKETKDGWICSLNGVEIYNPIDNTVRSSGADKVAAWFLDSDFDGRCFCITQAFFPDQNAWEKIAKALGSSADPGAFEAFKGTTSLPFTKGKYGRIAVKVIDPRGNEVMAVRKLG